MTEFLSAYPPAVLVTIALMFIVGGVVKGAIGFGLPLVTMSMLPLVMPIEAALAINALATPFNNVAQFTQARQARTTIRRFRHVLIGLGIGVAIGAVLVTSVNDRILILSLGCFVVLFTLLTALAPKVAIPPSKEGPVGAITGLAAGVIGALTTANGPILVMYLVGLKLDRVLFVSALGLFFMVTGITVTVSFLVVGLISVPVLVLAAFCVPASQLGMAFGNWLAGKLPAELFRTIVLFGLCALGINLIAQGLAI